MNEISEKLSIEKMIYEIRGKYVMLDSDLARIYECKNGTKVINQAVNRNIERFPIDFYFQLTEEEFQNLKSQFVTSSLNENNNLKFQFQTSNSKHGGIRKLPYAFTEQGVAMLATVIRTKIAAQTSVNIMRAFVAMRKYISSNLIEQKYINNIVLEDHDKIVNLEESFKKLEEKKKSNEIYFAGQIYDAYSKILEIFISAKEELIIIDSYADSKLLDIVRRLKVNVVIITKEDNLLKEQDIDSYNEQYNNLKVVYDNTFHDRYFIIDKCIIYHCGSSINRIGYKTFSINLISDEEVYKLFIERIKTIIN